MITKSETDKTTRKKPYMAHIRFITLETSYFLSVLYIYLYINIIVDEKGTDQFLCLNVEDDVDVRPRDKDLVIWSSEYRRI